jgi:hypothetical membrane protein
MTARRSSAILLFAALQFAVLSAIAMRLYPSYQFTENFLSDLGATRTWGGVPNHASAVVFAITVATLGFGFVIFASAWRQYAFAKQRARWLGIASQICGTLSGLAFVGVACTPIDHALDAHNVLVTVAHGLLLVFSICMTILWWRNGAPLGARVAGILYPVMLVGYGLSVYWAISNDAWAHRHVLIVGQKIVSYGSVAFIVFITLTIRQNRAT